MNDAPTEQEQPSGVAGEQKTYDENPYQDASWEIVGQLSERQEFSPMELEKLKGHQKFMADPMFADYGGVSDDADSRRWHLPEHLRGDGASESREEQEIEEEGLIKVREDELEALKHKAFEEGKQAGIAQAVEENVARLQDVEQRMGNVVTDLNSQVGEALQGIERNTVDLAIAIAKKIIEEAVEINPEYIIQVVNEAIAQSGAALVRKVRVSPEDLEFIDVIGVRKLITEHDESWDFEADPSIRSGCVVETSAGEVDFQLERAWERVKDRVLRVIR